MSPRVPIPPAVTAVELAGWVRDARQRVCELVADLDDDQLLGPRLPTVNPLLWEIGHVAWFQEKWVLGRAAGEEPIRPDGDLLYDSAAVDHATRWDLPLPSREETLGYLGEVRDGVLDKLALGELGAETAYFVMLSVFHEDMHTEAFTATRQTLGYRAPQLTMAPQPRPTAPLEPAGRKAGATTLTHSAQPAARGDVEIPGGTFWLGAAREEPFVFDNEKWAHAVQVRPFAIARTTVTQEEFSRFVADEGYRRAELWSPQGWNWRTTAAAEHPVYWRPAAGGPWQRRHFDRWVGLEPRHPMLHVNWYEADAYCRWAGRRLPTEVEWEVAASAEAEAGTSRLSVRKRRFAWGDRPPAPELANLDWRAMGTVDVEALAGGDSAFGCRQMIGNVWEWTASDFLPYPGFAADPYREYSAPWFGTHKVLRGGGWATRSRLVRSALRNFYTADRQDVWAGFRTCAHEQ